MKFALGRLVGTPGALAALTEAGQSPTEFVDRHVQGDWGDLDAEDTQANNEAVKDNSRILSSYQTALGTKIWIITEWDRSATTILLPSDY